MGIDPLDKLASRRNQSPSEQLHADRLDREGVGKSQWPVQIDRAALDLLYGIAIGKSDASTDIGGTIDRDSFPEAAGKFYVDGLTELSGRESDLAQSLNRYDTTEIGALAFGLNEFRERLTETGDETMDVDRAVEALIEKAATEALESSSRVDGNDGAGLRRLRDSTSTTDLVTKLFSDPRVEAYADELIDIVSEANTSDEESLIGRLDAPRMTTPLWTHQRTALRKWIENGQTGYVNMATATGKTVLGLAAIAARYGGLHPIDATDVPIARSDDPNPHVLVVAGNDVLLTQWRDEFDEHLEIPHDRTRPVDGDDGVNIKLDWGTIEFRTAQSLLQRSSVSGYDLVILDEAHRYSQSGSGASWGDLFDDLIAGSHAVLAMSGSIDGGWQGDDRARRALEDHLDRVARFTVPEARACGVIADFQWEVHYADAMPEDESNITAQTAVVTDAYDSLSGELDADALGVASDDVPSRFDDYDGLRAFVQTNAGGALRESSDAFDRFADAVLSRKTYEWNLSPVDDAIVDLVTRHAPAQKTVVIVQGYPDVARLRDRLVDEGFDKDVIVAPEGRDDDRSGKVNEFNDLDGGVIIGPGDLLGTGIDMPDAEVAINVARGGANASLVQRIGRVLRNPRGDKEAMFYHVVPRPTDDDAIDRYEDGHRLLRQAAEFHALGESFKEPPGFSVRTDAVERTVAALERAGEQLFDRLDDDALDDLVTTDTATDALREIRAAVRGVLDDGVDGSVVVDYWAPDHDDASEDSNGLSIDRDDRYESYRFARDQFRAARAVAEHVLGVNPEIRREDGTAVVSLDDYEGTTFHEHFERWTNAYHECEEVIEAAPGTFDEYREHWSAPRDTDGAMVQAEVATEIGLDYNNDDLLFFPRTDGDLYELPLPDGRVLSVDGLTDREPASIKPDDAIHVSTTLVLAAEGHADERGQDVDALVESWTRDLLSNVVTGDDPRFVATPETETTIVDLPDDVQSFVHAGCGSGTAFDTADALVETAIMAGLGLEPDTTDRLSATVPTLVKRAAERADVDIDTVVTAALRDAIEKQ